MSIIAEPRANRPDMGTLPEVRTEAQYITDIADEGQIHNQKIIGSTTIAQAEIELQQSNMVHMACHGVQDAKDALSSGFCLGDGELTVSRLMDLQLDKAFFAFMSACETAKGDQKQPDQVVHLAAAMLFAGFQSVVGTMW
jgi:CHAT domain-containing protein